MRSTLVAGGGSEMWVSAHGGGAAQGRGERGHHEQDARAIRKNSRNTLGCQTNNNSLQSRQERPTDSAPPRGYTLRLTGPPHGHTRPPLPPLSIKPGEPGHDRRRETIRVPPPLLKLRPPPHTGEVLSSRAPAYPSFLTHLTGIPRTLGSFQPVLPPSPTTTGLSSTHASHLRPSSPHATAAANSGIAMQLELRHACPASFLNDDGLVYSP